MESTSFPQFSLLPSELRCKIWRLALSRRIIPVRLRIDLDTWNSSTEADWWTNYRVFEDATPLPVPPGLLVNHEARHEIAPFYREPLTIDRAVLEAILKWPAFSSLSSAAAVGESGLRGMCDGRRIPRFNRDFDVLEWAGTRRWASPAGRAMQRGQPLFLAACLSVRHVSLEINDSMHYQLETLAFAVLDRDQPLQTLTIRDDSPHQCRMDDRLVGEFRLARRPAAAREIPKVTEGAQVRSALQTYPACSFPWAAVAAPPGGADDDDDDTDDYLFQFPDDMINARVLPLQHQPSLEPMTRLDSRYAIYQVLGPEHLSSNRSSSSRDSSSSSSGSSSGYVESLCEALAAPPEIYALLEHTVYRERDTYYAKLAKYGTFGRYLQADVAVWLLRMKVRARVGRAVDEAESFFIPCHGFCVADYGLP
ncbi:hypothetical protein F4778DRAFT_612393 [Xylariomycetidae sp. FL2044]|nr:hypothetical protein F4778DRAFT_612393 [Xylariomycetidae sp. FL2044]